VLLGARLPARADAAAKSARALDRFAKRAGLLFQVVDDILDCTAEHRHAGQDRRQGRRAPSPPARTINSPADLRRLDARRTAATGRRAARLPDRIVSQTGGHLSSNLGTVELTIALHYVFNTPDDRLVWDVGHQTYPHKILTGRRERMATLRQLGGISGFPRARERIRHLRHGHSSTRSRPRWAWRWPPSARARPQARWPSSATAP
jgi:hypothetical protein